jgi:hypothetical protein
MRNIYVLGVTQTFVVVKVYSTTNDATYKQVARHFP